MPSNDHQLSRADKRKDTRTPQTVGDPERAGMRRSCREERGRE